MFSVGRNLSIGRIECAVITIVAAESPVGPHFTEILTNGRFFGDHVDGTARRHGSVQHRARAADDFQALDRVTVSIAQVNETVAEKLAGVEAAYAFVVGRCMKLQRVTLRQQLEVADDVGRDDLDIHRQLIERNVETRCAGRTRCTVTGLAHDLDEIEDLPFIVPVGFLSEQER